MNITSTFQKREIEVYYEDLLVIRESLQEYNILFFSTEPVLLNELDVHRWAALKSFYDKILVAKIDKGKPKKNKVKLPILPGQLLAVFQALRCVASISESLALTRIMGQCHRTLFNIPYFNHKSLFN